MFSQVLSVLGELHPPNAMGRQTLSEGTPSPARIRILLRDTVNKRADRILPEYVNIS